MRCARLRNPVLTVREDCADVAAAGFGSPVGVYGRERLGDWWGFAAGWGFVIGKTASCAAMALTFASYACPWWAQRLAAVAGVLGLAALNYRGVIKTAIVTRILVAATVAALTVVVVGIVIGIGVGNDASASHLGGFPALSYRDPLHHAEIALAVIVSVLVLTVDLRGVIGFSSFGVLVYYGIANASAVTQRRWPRAVNVLGRYRHRGHVTN